MSRVDLPRALHAAYNWTEAAGELEELADIVSDPVWLASYARASAENAAESDSELGTEPDVFAADIVALAEWLAAKKAKDADDDQADNYDDNCTGGFFPGTSFLHWGGYCNDK